MDNTFPFRTEVWHPLSVHFPITLLICATLIGLGTLFLSRRTKDMGLKITAATLISGTITAWISIYTGNLADGIVARKICDPTVLKDHELASYNLAYLFTAASIIHLLIRSQMVKNKVRNLLHYFSVVLMVIGMGFLIYTGHLGASLVYEQGAGVNKPSADCAGFE